MGLNSFKKYLINPIINYLGQRKVKQKLSDNPIVIGGCGRSGTTLLLSIIGAHPKVYSFPREMAAFTQWYQKEGQDIPRIDRLHRHLLTNHIPQKVTRWCEKTPNNVNYFGQILDYFEEEVKLIHIIRDGRDVMLSRHPLAPDKYWVEPERWINDVRAGLEYKDHPQVLTIKYEGLILSYKETINQICNFLGEDYTAEMNSWIEHTNVQEDTAWFDSVEEIHSDSIEKWKKEENKERVEEVMANEEVVELLEELNYL